MNTTLPIGEVPSSTLLSACCAHWRQTRDVSDLNIMMDPRPLFPHLFHFARPSETQDMKGPARSYTRTRHPVKYFFIDFGLSRRFDPAAGPPRSRPVWGGDRSVPEFHKSLEPCDPFPTDIYYVGNVVRTILLQVRSGFLRLDRSVSHLVAYCRSTVA